MHNVKRALRRAFGPSRVGPDLLSKLGPYVLKLGPYVLTGMACGTVVLSQQAPPARRTALTGATVIDVVAGTTVPNGVIVIEGDRIAAFGDRTTPIPDGATRVDLSGKFVIPGLFDS